MGAHKTNGMAIKAAARDIPAIIRAQSNDGYGYSFEIAREANKDTMAKVTALLDAAKAAGKTPADVDLSPYNPEEHPEYYDLVVYHRLQVTRKILITNQTAVANIRGAEHYRISLAEVNNRAQQAFDGGPSEAQA